MPPRPEVNAGSPLAEKLLRCASVCEETLEAYRGTEETTGKQFFSSVMRAIAGIERVVATELDDASAEVALVICATLSREAADTVRAHGIDERLLRCADACERAADLCHAALKARRTP